MVKARNLHTYIDKLTTVERILEKQQTYWIYLNKVVKNMIAKRFFDGKVLEPHKYK